MSVEADSHGRLYLSSDLRQKYGEKFHVVVTSESIPLGGLAAMSDRRVLL